MNTRRVIKIGGSLFDFERLPTALRGFLAHEPPAPTILLAGGGDWAEALRKADQRFKLGDSAAHRLCLDAMSVTAKLLARLLDVRVITNLEEASNERDLAVFDVGPHWRLEEPRAPGEVLPESWRVTSDSIAARLAELTGATELVLLKSKDALAAQSLKELANSEYVDEHFPFAARSIAHVRFVNLRRWS